MSASSRVECVRHKLSARSLKLTGIIEVMSKSSSCRFPVTVTQLPVTR